MPIEIIYLLLKIFANKFPLIIYSEANVITAFFGTRFEEKLDVLVFLLTYDSCCWYYFLDPCFPAEPC